MYTSLEALIYSTKINGDKKRFKKVLMISVVLCLVLFIFLALNMGLFRSKFMTKNGAMVMDFLMDPVMYVQKYVCNCAADNPFDSNIASIFYIILLLSSAISLIEVCFVSWKAAIVILIFWITIIGLLVNNIYEANSIRIHTLLEYLQW
jgi:hypothetical protein